MAGLGPPAGFPSREAGHYDSAGARACDQEVAIYSLGEGNREPPAQRGKMSALFLEALRCGKGSFSFPYKVVVSRVGIQGKELTNRHMLENCFEW